MTEAKVTYPFVVVVDHKSDGSAKGVGVHGPFTTLVDALAQAYDLAAKAGKNEAVYRLDAYSSTKEGVMTELENQETAKRMMRFK